MASCRVEDTVMTEQEMEWMRRTGRVLTPEQLAEVQSRALDEFVASFDETRENLYGKPCGGKSWPERGR